MLREAGNKQSRQCPACVSRQLVPCRHAASGIVVDVCRHCRGLWFEAGELTRLLDVSIATPLAAWKNPDAGDCPECRIPLRKFEASTDRIEIHGCTACRGMWLHREQLQRIRQAPPENSEFPSLWSCFWHSNRDLLEWIDETIKRLLAPEA